MSNAHGRYACDTCQRIFPSKRVLKLHNDNHHQQEEELTTDEEDEGVQQEGAGKFPCEYCHGLLPPFSSRIDLSIHQCEVHMEFVIKSVICKFCKVRMSPEVLEQHENTHNPQNRPKCNVCKKTFASKKGLRIHGVIHKRDKKFKCQINHCSRVFKTRDRLQEHIKYSHNRESHLKFQCPFESCTMKFFTKYKLTRHYETHLRAEERKKFKCDICRLDVLSKSALNAHQRAQHGSVQRYKCSFCRKIYKTARGLEAHVEKKEHGQLYNCAYCNTKCATLKTLDCHLKLETHQKRHAEINVEINNELEGGEQIPIIYPCDKCLSTYETEELLQGHKNSAHGLLLPPGVHSCSQCGYCFTSSQKLKIHGDVKHNIPLPEYECNLCNVKCSKKGNFKNHCNTRDHKRKVRQEKLKKKTDQARKKQQPKK